MEARMLKLLKAILSATIIVLSVYALISQNFMFMPYSMFLLGALMLTTGLTELQKERKRTVGYLLLILSLFIFFVTVQDLIVN